MKTVLAVFSGKDYDEKLMHILSSRHVFKFPKINFIRHTISRPVFCQGRALAPLALKKSIWRREICIDGPLGASVFQWGRIVHLSIK